MPIIPTPTIHARQLDLGGAAQGAAETVGSGVGTAAGGAGDAVNEVASAPAAGLAVSDHILTLRPSFTWLMALGRLRPGCGRSQGRCVGEV